MVCSKAPFPIGLAQGAHGSLCDAVGPLPFLRCRRPPLERRARPARPSSGALQVRRAEGISDLESVHLSFPGLWEDDTPRELPGIPQVRHQKYSRTRIRGRPRGLLCRCATASPKQTIKITHDPTDNPNRDPKRAQVSSMLFGAGVSGSGELSAFAQSLVIALQCVLIAFFKSAPVGVGWNFQLRS